MAQRIRLGISTCPNDTFAFHALLNHKVDARGLEFQIELHDVQELNDALLRGEYDCAKASFHAALRLSRDVEVFSSGSALGFGVGPLLLAKDDDLELDDTPTSSNYRVLCPGEQTTATLLYRTFYPGVGRVENVVFSDIMPALKSGTADLGVCIHEGRFTWQEQGLRRIADLGESWEEATDAPLPLGGIVGRKQLGKETLATIQLVIRDSLEYAWANRDEARESMRKYAQEFDDRVLDAHVDLYVNEQTKQLGEVGRRALDELHRLATSSAAVPAHLPPLEIVGED